MKIIKYPQSAILIDGYENKRILIDPGSFCYDENFGLGNWGKIDILLFTHIHSDHFVPEVAKKLTEINPSITIVSNGEVCDELEGENIRCNRLEPNQKLKIEDMVIMGIKSIHGELPNGKPKPDVIGFLIDNKFYHPGDTIYLQEKPHAEILFVPVCGVVVMNVAEAEKFTKEVNPKLAIPIHYDNPNYPVDVNDFAEVAGSVVKILSNGEALELDS